MKYLEKIQRGIDFIEAHLNHELETADVARHAGLSHWHFQRIFKALTNETLKTYIRTRRFSTALELLLTTEQRIIEIAMAAGFQSQESFTRAFKHSFGVTPAQYRKQGTRHQFLRKPSVNAEYLRHMNLNISLEPELYEQPAICLVGMQTHFYGVESHKNNLAQRLPALWTDFLSRLSHVRGAVEGCCYGLVRPKEDDAEELEYFAGIEVVADHSVPTGMLMRQLPAGRYAKFTHHGHVAQLDQTVNYIYGNWLPRSRMRHSHAADIEFYTAQYHPTAENSVMHYAIPVADLSATGECRELEIR